MPKIRLTVSIGLVGCTRERVIDIPEEDLEGLNESEREEYIEEVSREQMFNIVSWNWQEME